MKPTHRIIRPTQVDYVPNNANATSQVSTTHGTLVIKNPNKKCLIIVTKNSTNPIQVGAEETVEKPFPIGTHTYSVVCGFNAGMPSCCSASGLLKNDKTFEIKANEKTTIGGNCY
ncbi:MAG: hypothetical protein HC817_10960 [Saprospiraceae bacterium]|nr:hypothetical protein [Saprospiraceae bacterium]